MLDNLVQTIETLKERISLHGAALSRNEIRTRAVLIDPMLCALGWVVSDPAVVTVEYETDDGRADYALLSSAGGNPALVMEAKKYDEPLDAHRMQLLTYALSRGIHYGCLTDGNVWQVYDVFAAFHGGEPQPLDQRRRLDVTIADEPPARSALAFLGLWRPNLQSAGSFATASAPFLTDALTQPPLETPARIATATQTLLNRRRRSVVSPSAPNGEGWTSLAVDFEVTNRPAPTEMQFPGRSAIAVRNWRGMLVSIAQWLHEQGILTHQNCQITRRGGQAIFSVDGRHANGELFKDPVPIGSTGLVLEGYSLSANSCVRLAKSILAHFRQDPSQVSLRLP